MGEEPLEMILKNKHKPYWDRTPRGKSLSEKGRRRRLLTFMALHRVMRWKTTPDALAQERLITLLAHPRYCVIRRRFVEDTV